MKERTSNLSLTALIAGVMSIITVFGGVTVFLGICFAFFGILAGNRGKRQQQTRIADWAVIISVLGFILCLAVSAIFLVIFITTVIGDGIPFPDIDYEYYFNAVKDTITNFIRQYI